MIVAKFIGVAVMGYILGSIPFGVLVGKVMGGVDVRKYGSGKTGTTNVLRTVGKKAAVLAALLDVLKGVLAVIFAGLIVGEDLVLIGGVFNGVKAAQVVAGLGAIFGHIWPVFLKFRGGRGVATFMGGLLALCPIAAVFAGVVMAILAGLTRFASLGSIAGAVSAFVILIPLTILFNFAIEYMAYASVGLLVILVMHRDNIARLISGKERRLGERTK